MTTSHDDERDDLPALDDAASTAAAGLRAHVLTRVDVERSLHGLGATPPAPRKRLLAVAAALLVVAGTVAAVGQGNGDDGRSRVELEEGLPDLAPGQLTPLGPRDGKDSIQLPLALEPAGPYADGDTVTVTGTGFVPGERVGIVQCAREAGGETREARGGVDGCWVGGVQYADADDSGAIRGTYVVQRILTTPLTGTVDCAAEAERCMVAAGALSDYDRSGGHAITMVGEGRPIEVPTVEVAPADGLADGSVVAVSGSGFTPNEVVSLSVCSADPATCWQTGPNDRPDEPVEGGEGRFAYPPDDMGGMFGLPADDDGEISGEVPVWRFLPGTEPGSYIDCAVSECSLRFSGTTAPAPARLAFEATDDAPQAPSLAVDPAEGLAPGDVVVVRGQGFEPGAQLHVSLCASPPGDPANRFACGSSQSGEERIDDDGAFAIEYEIPRIDDQGYPGTTICEESGCGEATGAVDITCDGVSMVCAINVEAYADGRASLAPIWAPAPVPLTFR